MRDGGGRIGRTETRHTWLILLLLDDLGRVDDLWELGDVDHRRAVLARVLLAVL